MIKKLFFWRKPKQNETDTFKVRAEVLISTIQNYLPEIRKIMRGDNVSMSDIEDENNKKTLYDFFNNEGSMNDGGTFFSGVNLDSSPNDPYSNIPPVAEIPIFTRIQAAPKEVLHELETIPSPVTMANLDEKIETLKDKSLLLNQRYAKAQIDALVERLTNRKKYSDHEVFYSSFKNTTDELIDKLIGKYLLVIKTSDLFVPTFPKEAIDIMKEYTRVTKLVCDKEPVYYVIAEEKDFKKKFEKLDPILLVQSPFGFYWQILGAWDKEMLLLTEL